MTKPKLSWQGVGISSNPFQKRDFLSMYLLAYLSEASSFSEQHVLVVPDTPQISNYTSLHGLSNWRAKRIAGKKGRQRRKDLERLCRVNGLTNVDVVLWEEAKAGNEDVFGGVYELFKTNPEIREAVLTTIPKRLRERTSDHETLAIYPLEELAAILSFPGIKFGHEREKVYDRLAARIHTEFGIGDEPEFSYSGLGLESIPGTGRNVEPYSSFVAPSRILLTDTRREFLAKLSGLPDKSREKYLRRLQAQWGESPEGNGSGFYNAIIRPSFRALVWPTRFVKATAMAGAMLTVLSLGGTYVHIDAEMIRQEKINEIPGFAFSGDVETCTRVVGEKIAEANRAIEEKYLIPNFFDA
jgi:hypothetical protein